MKTLICIIFLLIQAHLNCIYIYAQSSWFYQQSNSSINLYGVGILNTTEAIAVGDSGVILKTENGGNQWYEQQRLGYNRLRKIAFQNNACGYTVGDSGKIFRSTDSGITFTEQYSTTTLNLNDICILDSSSAVIVGDSSIILKTTDYGSSWIRKTSGSCCYLDGIDFNSNGVGIAVGHLGSIVRTDDFGENWALQNISVSSLHSIEFINDSVAVAVGNGTIIKTTDYGISWVTISNNIYTLWDISFINENVGWSVGNWIIQKTTDGGESWINEIQDTIGWLFAVDFYDESFGITVGSLGSILSTTILNNYFTETNDNLSSFTLHQNYPNPFNPSTVISYRLPVTSNVTLKVYDVLGNEILSLVNEEKPAGTYEVEFNANRHSRGGGNLPSGIYFYQLKAGSFVETKKMILLK